MAQRKTRWIHQIGELYADDKGTPLLRAGVVQDITGRKVAEQGVRPAVDLTLTNSSLLTPEIVGERHYVLSVQVQALLQKYESLKGIIAIIGENELSPSDRADYAKAKKLIANFSQNMNVMTKHNGVPGDYFTREETLKSIEEIII